MNMKKTLAGVMAGAMAVSAMAVSVSAANTNPVATDVQEEIVLTYDLRAHSEFVSDTPSKTIVRELYTAVDGEAYAIDYPNVKALTFGASHWSLDYLETADVRVTKTNQETTKSTTDPFLYTRDKATANESGYMYTINMFTADNDDQTITIPVQVGGGTQGIVDLSNYKLSELGYTGVAATYGFSSLEVTLTFVNTAAWVDLDTHVDAILSKDDGIVDAKTLADERPDSVKAIKVIPGTYRNYVYPMMSDLDDPADVIAWLNARKQDGNRYTRPIAVLNDAIANDQNVIFEFRSAQERVGAGATFIVYECYNNGVYTGSTFSETEAAESDVYTSQKVVLPENCGTADVEYTYAPGKKIILEGLGIVPKQVALSHRILDNGDWYNPYFSQHLYGESVSDHFNDFAVDDFSNYGSHSTAWGVNLFNGALVINQNLTMQLNQTDVFDWDYDSLTFDWFTLTDAGKITRANQLLNTMLLYTPVEWFWDQLTVTVAAAEGDNVEAGEGLDGEGDTLDDEDADEDVGDIDIVDDTEEPEPEPEPAPAPNPTTGNAPVALAVIPVALAAAAVVAKKRG